MIKRLTRDLTFLYDNLKPVPSTYSGQTLSHVEGSKVCTELRRSIQNPKWMVIIAIAFAFTMCGAVALAQQPKKVPRIGYLTAATPSTMAARTEALR